jgi:hypothetical protein
MSDLLAGGGDNFIMCVCSMQGGGKSNCTLLDVLFSAYGNPNVQDRRKALIIDVNGNEYREKEIFDAAGNGTIHQIKTIRPDEIIAFSNHKIPEVRRINFIKPNGMPMSQEESSKLVVKILEEFRSGTIVCEDLTKIFPKATIPDSVISTLVNVRHKNVSVVIHYQSLNKMNTTLRENAKVIRMHYQLDGVESTATNKFKSELECLCIAEKIIYNQYVTGDKYFHLYIYREHKKIVGEFSNKMMMNAIIEYLSENKRRFRAYLDKRDTQTGKLVYNYNSALMAKAEELFFKYCGNLEQ